MSTMTPALLAALNASFTAGGWRTVGVQTDQHTESVPGVDDAPPTTATRMTATLQIEHAEKQMLLVFVLSGTSPGDYTEAKLIGRGCFETDNPVFVGRLAATIAPALAAMEAALVAELTGI